MELEQEIFATKVKINQLAALEAQLAAAAPQRADSRPRLLPAGSSRAELEKNMDEIRSKCDEILSMADDDFSDSDFSDIPDETLKLEVEGNPDNSEASTSERGPDSWRASSEQAHQSWREEGEHGPDSWRAPSDGSHESWREPGEHGPDSWRAPSVSENDPEGGETDSYGYGVTKQSNDEFPVDSLAKTPDSSLAVYEDPPSMEARSLPDSDVESSPESPAKLLSPSAGNYQSAESTIFNESAPAMAQAGPVGLAVTRSMESTEPVFADDSVDMPSTVGAASASVGISAMLSLTMEDDSTTDSNNSAKKAAPTDFSRILVVTSPSRTAETQQSHSSSTSATKEDTDAANFEANIEEDAGDFSSVESGMKSDSWDPDSTDEHIVDATSPTASASSSAVVTEPRSQQISVASADARRFNGDAQKKEYSMLDSALETDDLHAIELNASKLAESLKSRLNNTTLTDLGTDPPPIGDGLSLKISASFDTDASESMADIILNTLLQPDLESFINLSEDSPIEEAPRAIDVISEGSSDSEVHSPSDSNGMVLTPSAGESSGVFHRNNMFSSSPVLSDSENGNAAHTQKAGEPSRGDLRSADLNGISNGESRAIVGKLVYPGSIEASMRGNGESQNHVGHYGRNGKSPVSSSGESHKSMLRNDATTGGPNAKSPISPRSTWSPPDDLNLRMPKDSDNENTSPVRQRMWSPPDNLVSSFDVGDWAAVGLTASALADDTDSVSTSSRADSVSVSSVDATRSASALDTPMAEELDKLVGSVDWDGVKNAAVRFETTSGEDAGRTSLDEARRRKREIEAWRSSISESFSKNPEYN